jgi:hypothetical protein
MTDNDVLLSDLHDTEGSFLQRQKNAGSSEENLDVTKWIKFCNMNRHATTPHLHSECPYIKFQVTSKKVQCQRHSQPVLRYSMNILPSCQEKHH